MIFAPFPKKICVMLTAFRDGLQSVFGGNVRVDDVLPAMQAAAAMGIRHFEFGGGARYQAPYFYAGEDPFVCMDKMRDAVGPNADLQILTRSVSGVTLTTQRLKALEMQARLMKKHGTTIDRNFDFMNDVDNLVKTGQPIVDAGMHHQVCVAMMGLPYQSDQVHTPDFYIRLVQKLLSSGIHFDSVCMKDASGTTDPHTCYETAKGLKKILPSEIPLSMHTHDTASMAVACYMAGIAGGVDRIDLSVRPLASGTAQPDVRSMWHALKGTGYALDIDASKMDELEKLLDEGLKEYSFNPVTTSADARVVNFPMPGGAIGPNVQMMAEAGILNRYGEVLAEFPEVVRAGGAWTSVTPGSQQYWLQAFNNVLHGRWKKIDAGYGRSVLGYFGRTPEAPDPAVIKLAIEQLKLEPFDGDPLEKAPDSIALAEEALRERKLALTEENIFLVASAIVPGKNMELNEGIRLLTGKAKINLPLKSKDKPAEIAPAAPTAPAPAATVAAPAFTTPMTTQCTVVEGGFTRTFRVTIDPPAVAGSTAAAPATAIATPAPVAAPAVASQTTPVFSPFEGKVELVDIHVKVGERVQKGHIVAAVEAMKAKHDVRAPCEGVIVEIHADLGSSVSADKPILSIGG
ncbi:biotin/lipoyl-containing protein [Candidatus Contendibacter odensensis]|uniref:Carboxylase n=1 Tax=Candidatus Contendobacter odensis Run_B_J11 TaxID=1400861 RepID=A0A7U7J1R6_9GAMM|nr:biotin/lipoyl-containing protein [Candidatus Contendobacter odensis]MBK8754392.1 biotin attachment protein [Candidatus Competibacteraceae bacterium]CDH43101.1 putative carboxylase [Candidatus Contendobacter odensis Run_B_J11]